MTRIAKTFIAALTLISVSAFASQVEADEYTHIDNLALQIEAKSKLLVKETLHYRYTPYYRHLRRDAQALKRLSRHIHQLVHRESDIFHVAEDLAELDRSFHHIEDLIRTIERDARYCVGTIVGRTRHVKVLLKDMERCIHHMRDDIEAIKRRQLRRSTCPTTVVRQTYYTAPGMRGRYGGDYGSYGRSSYHGSRSSRAPGLEYGHYGSDRGGITLGNDRFQFNIGF